MDTEALIHFVGGAVGGTIGTALTCPLEDHVRRQSYGVKIPQVIHVIRPSVICMGGVALVGLKFFSRNAKIIASEGIGALYKGLLPNLIGVAPSKAVYFYAYSSSKRFLNDTDLFVPNSAVIHMLSAGVAGFLSATAVNPIWLVKTRLQLNKSTMSVGECFKRVFRKEGIRGFYKGVTASYAGVSETVIQFVIYEELRNYLMQLELNFGEETVKEQRVDFINFMIAGGFAKFVACIVAYPHEVARTRLREENSKNKGFFATLSNVYRLEGFRALYRGLPVQLMRTVPNTAVTMGAYELVVIILQQLLLPS